jgi:hypothetical protein
MTYTLLKFAHVLGAILMGGGLIAVWLSDLRSRQLHELPHFAEAVRNIAVFCVGVVPGAILLLVSGAWLIIVFFGGWGFIKVPWLASMVILFAFEFIEGNTITRVYFMRLLMHTNDAQVVGGFTPQLERARAESVATFTHFLDLPILFLIVALGVIKPVTWAPFLAGLVASITIAAALTIYIPRLYPWGIQQEVPKCIAGRSA